MHPRASPGRIWECGRCLQDQDLADLRGEELHEVFTQRPADLRRFLESFLIGKLTFIPMKTGAGNRYKVEGDATLGGIISLPPSDPCSLRPQRESKTPRTSASEVADRRGNDEDRATKGDAKLPEVSASTTGTDEAIRIAAKLAIDTGDMKRARALLDLLDQSAKPASVLVLAKKTTQR